MRVSLTARRPGMQIFWEGLPVSLHSEMVITTPPWTPHFYLGPSDEAVAKATLVSRGSATGLLLHHVGLRESFTADEQITLLEDGRIEQTLEGSFHEDGEALIQWRIAALDATLLVGRPFRAELLDGSVREGLIPVEPTGPDVAAATIAKDFRSLSIETRVGPLRIEVDSPHPLIVYDYRKSEWADPSSPFFWFGEHGTRFTKDKPLKYRIVYSLPPPSPAMPTAEPLVARIAVRFIDSIQNPRGRTELRLVPRPKEVSIVERSFLAGNIQALDVEVGPQCANTEPAVTELKRYWSARLRGSDSARRGRIRIRFEPLEKDNLMPAGGYTLDTTKLPFVIRAADAEGFLYAIQTLKQLSCFRVEGAIEVIGAEIRDWPDLPFRGVHLFTGGAGTALHEMLLRDVIAACKMNHVVLESEYIEWDSHPEIHHPAYGMPKAEVRQLLALCRGLGLEVTPLVQTLGHCQWMFETGHNLELAEDPDARWAYCITNPKTYDFIFEIFAEALELFEPRYLHIGHDEFADRGRVPFRESSKPYSIEELLMMDTLKLHGWLKERGVQTMLWGDMFLAKGEAPDACNAASPEAARVLRDKLPDDVLITDWHYAATDAQRLTTSLEAFHDAGLKTVAASWNRAVNVVNLAHAAYIKKSLGLLQTTWAGYSLDPESFAREEEQYQLYVLAAEAAWNAATPPDPATYRPGWIFHELTGQTTWKPTDRHGATFDLAPAYNYGLAAADEKGWFGLGKNHDLSATPSGLTMLRQTKFQFGPAESKSVIALHGKLAAGELLPREATLPIEPPLSGMNQLAIVCATNFPAGAGAKIADLVLHCGKSKQVIELVYGKNLLAVTDLTAVAAAPPLWTGQTPAGEDIAWRALVVDLPADAPLTSLTFRAADAAPSLLVAAITALGEPK